MGTAGDKLLVYKSDAVCHNLCVFMHVHCVGPGLRSVQTRWLVEYTQNGACSNYGNYLGWPELAKIKIVIFYDKIKKKQSWNKQKFTYLLPC